MTDVSTETDIAPVESGRDDINPEDVIHIVCCQEVPYVTPLREVPTLCGHKLVETEKWRDAMSDEDFCRFCLYLSRDGHCARGGRCHHHG